MNGGRARGRRDPPSARPQHRTVALAPSQKLATTRGQGCYRCRYWMEIGRPRTQFRGRPLRHRDCVQLYAPHRDKIVLECVISVLLSM